MRYTTLMSWLFVAAAVLLAAPSAQAFKPNEEFGHGFITRSAVRATSLPFCPEAVDNLVEGDLNVDFGREFFVPPAHCDDENINECTTRIATFRDLALAQFALALGETEDLTARNGAISQAWALVGRALHTLQDFYAHSNWIKLGNTDIHNDVGQRPIASNPTANDIICQDDRATHVGTVLSTGYFPIGVFKDLCTDEVPRGKCRHGMEIPLYNCPEGLNNDEPTRPQFTQAQQLAIRATTRYLTDIHALLATPDLQELFLGTCGISMHYVVDVTSSMGPDISGIIEFIRNQTQSTEAAEVSRFGLTVFGTGGEPVTRSYATAAGFLAALGNATSGLVGTGSTTAAPPTTPTFSSNVPNASAPTSACADYLFTALLAAAQEAPRRAELRVFADTGTRDGALAGLAAATALSKQQTVRFFLTGDCATELNVTNSTAGIDAAIGAFAENTGALVIATNKTDVYSSLRLVTTRLLPGAAVVFAAQMPTTNRSASETSNTTNTSSTSPQCSSTPLCYCARVNFTAPAWGSAYVFAATYRDRPGLLTTAALFGPSGGIALNISNFTGATEASAPSLPSGTYLFQLCGNIADLVVTVTGVGHSFPFHAEDFAVSQLLGRPGEAAQRPSLSAPVLGASDGFGIRMRLANASVLADGALSNLTVHLLSANNTVVLVSTPVSYFATGDTEHVLVFTNGTITIPRERFFVVVQGLYRGAPFQVALDTPVVPQPLSLGLKQRSDSLLERLEDLVMELAGMGHPAPFATLPLNRTSDIEFSIFNDGSEAIRAAFSVNSQIMNSNSSVFDDFNVTLPEPMTIAAGSSETARFQITPRAGLLHNATYQLVFAAHNTEAPVQANFLQTEVQFVGCADCPQDIGVCEVVNGTYQCNCYLGVTQGSCASVEEEVEDAATLAAGVIAAIVIAAVVGCCLFFLIIYCCCVRPRRAVASQKSAADSTA
eukprot:m.57631 g.57631  ORF g.57631 m.57631 type:complete len:948 (-) comp12120_c0_seq2:179-3022(-)